MYAELQVGDNDNAQVSSGSQPSVIVRRTEFGVRPCLSHFLLATDSAAFLPSSKPLTLSQTQSAVFFLNKLKHNSLQRRKVRPLWLRVHCLHSTEKCLIRVEHTGLLAGVHVWAFSLCSCAVYDCYLCLLFWDKLLDAISREVSHWNSLNVYLNVLIIRSYDG